MRFTLRVLFVKAWMSRPRDCVYWYRVNSLLHLHTHTHIQPFTRGRVTPPHPSTTSSFFASVNECCLVKYCTTPDARVFLLHLV